MSSPSPEPERVARYFHEHAVDFDTIYESRKGPVRELRDRLSRGTVVERLTFVDDLVRNDPPGRVLDVGCGSGRFSVSLARRGWEAVGLDFADDMIALANKQALEAGVADRCRFEVADFLDWHDDAPFDLGLAIGVFDYVAQPAPLLARLAAVSNGRVVASFPKRYHPLVPLRWARLRAAGCPVHFYVRGQVEAFGRAHLHRPTVMSFKRDYLLVGEQ
jgi:ubiquinone/menaquinone biosynthesis C-methylase UbiE